jgi:hypothetical protein
LHEFGGRPGVQPFFVDDFNLAYDGRIIR